MADVAGEERHAQTAVTMDPPRTFRRVPLLPHQLLKQGLPRSATCSCSRMSAFLASTSRHGR